MTSIGFTNGAQSIFFTESVLGTDSAPAFVMNCGGNNNDCLDTATVSFPGIRPQNLGRRIAFRKTNGRSLSLASLDPPGSISLNLVF